MTGLAKAGGLLRCLDYTVAMETGVKMLWISSYTDILHITFCTDDRLFYMLTNTTASILLICIRLSGKRVFITNMGSFLGVLLSMCIHSWTCAYAEAVPATTSLPKSYGQEVQVPEVKLLRLFQHKKYLPFFFSLLKKPPLCRCSCKELTQIWRPAVVSLVLHKAVGKNPKTLDEWGEI